MREIKAIIRLERLNDVLHALRQVPKVAGVTVSTVEGFGRTAADSATEPGYGRVQMSKVEIVVSTELVDAVLEAIVAGARTGRPGDGKIFIAPVERIVQIRAGLQPGGVP